MSKLDFLYNDDDKHYAVRICMPTADMEEPVSGSVVRMCEGCECDVWYDTTQIVPPQRGVVFEREVNLCIKCAMEVMTQHNDFRMM